MTMSNELPATSGKGRLIILWTLSVLTALTFFAAGGPKLAGAPAMVEIFDKVGFGQWFRYFTGLLEVNGCHLLADSPLRFLRGDCAGDGDDWSDHRAANSAGTFPGRTSRASRHHRGYRLSTKADVAAHCGQKPGERMNHRIGIRTRPDQVADELAIRALAYAFTDAVNRRDATAFESLWDDDGVWEIGAPLHSIANGAANIAAHMIELAEPLEFFVQQVHSGGVAIDGDQASARWSVQETGRTRNNGPYNNHAFYEDEIVKRYGAWRFARRSYRYVWLDLKSPIGGNVIGQASKPLLLNSKGRT
jgi:ketosteroid isomerase-like protein